MLVLSQNLICLLAGQPIAINCEPKELAEKGGIALGIVINPADGGGKGSKRRFEIFGVVPRDKQTVRLVRSHGADLRIRPHNGYFAATSREPLRLP